MNDILCSVANSSKTIIYPNIFDNMESMEKGRIKIEIIVLFYKLLELSILMFDGVWAEV
jgi:hypothetical protein